MKKGSQTLTNLNRRATGKCSGERGNFLFSNKNVEFSNVNE
jgi:hypothetical protein